MKAAQDKGSNWMRHSRFNALHGNFRAKNSCSSHCAPSTFLLYTLRLRIYRAGQPIPDHNVVSRSVEEASAIGGGGLSNGFSGEGDALMRRERDHFFRSLKRSMPLSSRAAAMPMKMRATDHFFRTLRASAPDETNHFFREGTTCCCATYPNHFVTYLAPVHLGRFRSSE